MQKAHSEGSSLTAFSTARLRQHRLLLISQRQLGHVACSSLSRASARRWMKQPAHIRCPLVHWGEKPNVSLAPGGETESRKGSLDAPEAGKMLCQPKKHAAGGKSGREGDGVHSKCRTARGIAPK